MRRFLCILTLAVLLGAFQAVPGAASGDAEEISDALRAKLQAPVREKIKDLLEEKNDLGASYLYGSYYNDFTPAGDDYQVTFIKRISQPDELVTERYTLTLRQEGGDWKIADEKLEQRVEGLFFRSVPRDETFHEFDSFSFDREGLELSSGPGELIVDYRRGEPVRLMVRAEDLTYDYMTPVELGWYGAVLKHQIERFPKDIVFEPEYVYATCTPGQCKELMSAMFEGLEESTRAAMTDKTQKEYEQWISDAEKARKEHPTAGYRPVNRPGVDTWWIAIKKKGRDHWASLSYDSEARHEMKFRVTALGDTRFYNFPLFIYNSEETRNSGIDPYEIERRDDIYDIPGGGRYTLDYDVKGLTGSVDLAVEDDEMMACDFTYELTAKRDLVALPFFVAQAPRHPGEDKPAKTPTLDVYTMEDGEGSDLTYVRLGATNGAIVFPEPIPAGTTFKIHTKFDNNGAIYVFNHTYSRVNRGGWAPFVSFTDNIDYLDLTISVDDKYDILGIDNQISEVVKDGRRIERYKSDFPLTFPTIIFGDYLSDSSKVQAKKRDGTPIPVSVFVDKTSARTFTRETGSSGGRIAYHRAGAEEHHTGKRDEQADYELGVRDIRGDALRPIADQAANAINLYEEIYGVDYPFDKLDLVSDPMGSFYGQAPPSIVYLGFGVFWPTARVNMAIQEGDLSDFQNTVVAHELGHQWWGSAIVNKNFGNYWFVETLAEYSSALYSEAMGAAREKDPEKAREKGWAEYMKAVEGWRRFMLGRPNLFTSVQHSDSMRPGIEANARTAAIYNKGPYAFHMMRLLFGDEKFFRFLKDLAQEFEGKEIVTRDIQRVAESSLCGVDDQGNPCSYDLEWFFDQWIRGVGLPEYSFNYTYRQAEDGNWVVEGDIRQRVVIGAAKIELPGEVFRGRTTITVIDKKGNEYNVPVVIDAEVTPFAFKVPREPLEIVMNKNGDMLAHDVKVNQPF